MKWMGLNPVIFIFWMQNFKPSFSLSSFTFIKRLFCSSSLSAIRVVHIWDYWYFCGNLDASLCFIQPGISSMMYSAYKSNKQGDNIQCWHTPFPIWNQSIVPCLVLIVASWPAYTFLRRQVRWSGIPISLRIFHSLLWSTQYPLHFDIVSKADVFLELLLFLWSNSRWQFDLWFLCLF